MLSKKHRKLFACSGSSWKAFQRFHESETWNSTRRALAVIAAGAAYAFFLLSPGQNAERFFAGEWPLIAPWHNWPATIFCLVIWRLLSVWSGPMRKFPRLRNQKPNAR